MIRIQVADDALVEDLCAHFVRSSFTATSVGDAMVEVRRPGAATLDQERREVLLHLRVWEIVNPGVAVTLESDT